MRLYLAGLSVVVGLSGCDVLDIGYNCTTDPNFAVLNIAVVDSTTGSELASHAISVFTVRGGADTVRAMPAPISDSAPGHFWINQRGTYTVEATATGYRPWVQSGIRFTESERCSKILPRQMQLTARLQN